MNVYKFIVQTLIGVSHAVEINFFLNLKNAKISFLNKINILLFFSNILKMEQKILAKKILMAIKIIS